MATLQSALFGGQASSLKANDLLRMRLAQQLLAGGTDTSPIQHPLQGVARLGQALAGGYIANNLDTEQRTREARTASTMAQALRATQSGWKNPDTGETMPIPNAQGGMQGAIGVLSGNPDTAALAAQLGFGQIEGQQKLQNEMLKDKGLVQGPSGWQNAPGYAESVAGAAGLKTGAEEKAKIGPNIITALAKPADLAPGAQRQVPELGAAIANQYLGGQPGQSGPVQPGMTMQNTTPPPSTRVEVHAGQSLADSASKDVIERLGKGADGAKLAIQSMNTTGVLKDLLNKGIVTGTGAELETTLRAALDKAGIINDPKVPATQAFVGAVGQLVMSKVKNLGSGAGITEKDVKFTERVVGGDIAVDERAIRTLLDINERADKYILEGHNKSVDHALSGPGPLQNPIIQHMLKGYRMEVPKGYSVPGVTPPPTALKGEFSIRPLD
jgi:hypothetical protein